MEEGGRKRKREDKARKKSERVREGEREGGRGREGDAMRSGNKVLNVKQVCIHVHVFSLCMTIAFFTHTHEGERVQNHLNIHTA